MIGAHSFAGINFWAVLVSAIATMVIGFLWYSPMLFANPWMRLMGIDPTDQALPDQYGIPTSLLPRCGSHFGEVAALILIRCRDGILARPVGRGRPALRLLSR